MNFMNTLPGHQSDLLRSSIPQGFPIPSDRGRDSSQDQTVQRTRQQVREENRRKMPMTARMSDHVRSSFGAGSSVSYACENGHTVGTSTEDRSCRASGVALDNFKVANFLSGGRFSTGPYFQDLMSAQIGRLTAELTFRVRIGDLYRYEIFVLGGERRSLPSSIWIDIDHATMGATSTHLVAGTSLRDWLEGHQCYLPF